MLVLFFFVHAVHSPPWPCSHDHCTWRCLHCSFQNLMSFWVPAADHEMKAWTWWLGVGFRACRWVMKADNWRNCATSAASCLISRNRIRPFKFQQFFIQHNKNSFFGFVCQLIQQQHLKCLEACFWIWEWFRSRDGNELYPYVKCPKCFSETINKNKQPLRLNYQYYKLSRITAWDPRKICGMCFHVIILSLIHIWRCRRRG